MSSSSVILSSTIISIFPPDGVSLTPHFPTLTPLPPLTSYPPLLTPHFSPLHPPLRKGFPHHNCLPVFHHLMSIRSIILYPFFHYVNHFKLPSLKTVLSPQKRLCLTTDVFCLTKNVFCLTANVFLSHHYRCFLSHRECYLSQHEWFLSRHKCFLSHHECFFVSPRIFFVSPKMYFVSPKMFFVSPKMYFVSSLQLFFSCLFYRCGSWSFVPRHSTSPKSRFRSIHLFGPHEWTHLQKMEISRLLLQETQNIGQGLYWVLIFCIIFL